LGCTLETLLVYHFRDPLGLLVSPSAGARRRSVARARARDKNKGHSLWFLVMDLSIMDISFGNDHGYFFWSPMETILGPCVECSFSLV